MVVKLLFLILIASCTAGIWLPSGKFLPLDEIPIAEIDNSWRNKVPSSGQMRGNNDYGCGPIRI
jgi:hypothetical protein